MYANLIFNEYFELQIFFILPCVVTVVSVVATVEYSLDIIGKFVIEEISSVILKA